MSVASQTYAALQRLAREHKRPLTEYLTLYAMECFLGRLAKTKYKHDFVLKGGVLLAAYKLRRPTRDIDMEAVDFALDAEHLRSVVTAVADVVDEDALTIDSTLTTVEAIREGDDYGGLRVGVKSKVYESSVTFHLDISTGDPIWPAPAQVDVPRLLGGKVTMAGYPIGMVIAEKAVTILSRGASSTRWRDIVDLRNFSLTQDFNSGDLRVAVEHVATHRSITLESIKVAAAGWPEVAQTRWGAWRRKLELEDQCLESFADQLSEIAEFIDPVFIGALAKDATWSHATRSWAAN
jgi:hypothetical protein